MLSGTELILCFSGLSHPDAAKDEHHLGMMTGNKSQVLPPGTVVGPAGQLLTSQGQLIPGGQAVLAPNGQVIAAPMANHIGPQPVVAAGQLHQLLNSAGQPIVLTAAQQLQLQQVQLQQQAHQLKKLRGRDQAAALLQQQAALQHHITQGKISPTPLRRSDIAAGLHGLQQQISGKLGRAASAIPTAALLCQSTVSTSDKQRESALSTLQR